MALQWQRWLKYAQAKLDSSLKQGEAELDRRESELEARSAGRPWLGSNRDAPSFDEAKARIEHQTGEAEQRRAEATEAGGSPSAPSPRSGVGGGADLDAFDMAKHQQAAEDRLAAMRDELGLDDDAAGAKAKDTPSGDRPPLEGEQSKGETSNDDGRQGRLEADAPPEAAPSDVKQADDEGRDTDHTEGGQSITDARRDDETKDGEAKDDQPKADERPPPV